MADGIKLSGPVEDPASGGPARQLVVFLHGVGADGEDLIGLAPFLSDALPDAAFVSPDAPFPYAFAPMGRQWFDFQDRSPRAYAEGIRTAAPILDAFLDQQLAEYGLDDSKLALVGFSQGTMMALHVAVRRAKQIAGVVGFSGALHDVERLAPEIKTKPPVLLIHGDSDPVVPPTSLTAAYNALVGVGISVEHHMRPRMGHSIDQFGLQTAGAFLRKCFGLEGS